MNQIDFFKIFVDNVMKTILKIFYKFFLLDAITIILIDNSHKNNRFMNNYNNLKSI